MESRAAGCVFYVSFSVCSCLLSCHGAKVVAGDGDGEAPVDEGD